MDLRHVLFLLLLISRIGDLGTTYLVTPTMALEANPIARKLGWFMLVSASNAAKIWVARAMGEEAYLRMHLDLARKSKQSHALLGVAVSCAFIILAGVAILAFYPGPATGSAFWIGFGVVVYGAAMWMYGSLWFRRLYRMAATAEPR
jgi:hypothetical protein